jgi:hypothetical protein
MQAAQSLPNMPQANFSQGTPIALTYATGLDPESKGED